MGETVGLGKEESHYVWNRGNKNLTEAGETCEKSLEEKCCACLSKWVMGAQPYLLCLGISECSHLAGVTQVKQNIAKQELFSVENSCGTC